MTIFISFIFTILLLLLLVPAGISALTTYTGHSGQSVQINCPYTSGFETTKFLCRGKCLPWEPRDIPVQSGSAAKDQRFSLEDKKAAGIFTITITDLKPEDAGQYWCVIERPFLHTPDYTEIQLLVKSDAPKPFVAHSTFTPLTVQTQSTHLPLLASTGFIILYGLVSLLISGIALGVLVWFCKRRKNKDAVSSERSQTDVGGVRDGDNYENDPPRNQNSMAVIPIYQSINPKTNQPDSVYHTLHPSSNQSDSVYQSLNPNTNQSDSVYQSLNPNINETYSDYRALNPNTNQSDSVYQSLNPNTNQSDSVYQSLNPTPTNQIQPTRP